MLQVKNKDGPYTAHLNKSAKTLVLETVQAGGVHLRMELLQEKEFRHRHAARKKTPPN